MKKVFAILITIACFACKQGKNKVIDNAEVEVGNAAEQHIDENHADKVDMPEGRFKDVDTIFVEGNIAKIRKSDENNHFELDIDLPHADNANVNLSILTWINHILNYGVNADNANVNDENLKNQKFKGNVNNVFDMMQFYADKHFYYYPDKQLGIDYKVQCRQVFQSKDIITYEIKEFFCNYSSMETVNNCTGASFFKFNGDILSWAMFEDSNVKQVVKREINTQFLKLQPDDYDEFLRGSNYHSFSLPANPPYLTLQGLKFVYRIDELVQQNFEGQIFCIVKPEDIKMNQQLADILK